MTMVLFIIAGVQLTVALFSLLALCEAIILWQLEWGSFSRSLLDSLSMNLVSTPLVLILCCWALFSGQLDALGLWALLPSWVLSVLIEGGVLTLLKRHPARQTWLVSLAANTESYLLLIALTILWRLGLLRL